MSSYSTIMSYSVEYLPGRVDSLAEIEKRWNKLGTSVSFEAINGTVVAGMFEDMTVRSVIGIEKALYHDRKILSENTEIELVHEGGSSTRLFIEGGELFCEVSEVVWRDKQRISFDDGSSDG